VGDVQSGRKGKPEAVMFDDLIAAAAANYNVPEIWIRGVIRTESSWNPRAFRQEAHDASYGLMQLLTGTAAGLGYRGAPEGLYDPAVNIDLGTKLLGQIRARVGDDVQAVYSMYNSGSPTKYQTSSQVATNVSHFLKNLQTEIEANPFVASTGVLALAIAGLVIWYWTKKKGK